MEKAGAFDCFCRHQSVASPSLCSWWTFWAHFVVFSWFSVLKLGDSGASGATFYKKWPALGCIDARPLKLNSTDPVEQRTAKSVVFLLMTSRPTNWVNCSSRCRVEFSWVELCRYKHPLNNISRSYVQYHTKIADFPPAAVGADWFAAFALDRRHFSLLKQAKNLWKWKQKNTVTVG